jgi:hypothetical protein
LLFLHADCAFPAGGLGAVERTLAEEPAATGGNFRLVFDGVAYRHLRLEPPRRRYYGDSGVFVWRDAYAALGGIRPIALMEDHDDSVRRLERFGRTRQIVATPLVTSAHCFSRSACRARCWARAPAWSSSGKRCR